MKPVALVNMPIAFAGTPSLALSTLKPQLERRGIGCDVHHLELRFFQMAGYPLYETMLTSPPDSNALQVEWIFLTGDQPPDEERDRRYLDEIVRPLWNAKRRRLGLPLDDAECDAALGWILRARSFVRPFLDRCQAEVPWGDYRVVGFTSIFQQRMAVQALARRLRRAHPHLFLIVGGPNCEGPMGPATLRTTPELDAVCSGEGDEVFPELVERLLAGRPLGDLPGIHRRDTARRLPLADGGCHAAEAPPVENLDALPIPDHDDWFAERARLGGEWPDPELAFESSRGCWYGAKAHCTFCGINDHTIGFRSKSADRIYSELEFLASRHQVADFYAVDNILPMDYFDTVLPRLKEAPFPVRIWLYQAKANLKRSHIAAFRDAGVKMVQAGIESLVTSVLDRMDKGVTALLNIQTLKWARRYGLAINWMHLYGVPGESPSEYRSLPELMGSLTHLQPPKTPHQIRFHRFAPNFERPDDFGIRNLRPLPVYRLLYPDVDEATRFDLAYHFDAEFDGQERVEEYAEELRRATREWGAQHAGSALFSVEVGEQRAIVDLRAATRGRHVVVSGLGRALLDACDSVATLEAIERRLAAAGVRAARSEIEALLDELIERKLILRDGEQQLALVVPLGDGLVPGEEARRQLDALAESIRRTPARAPIAAAG